MCITIVYTISIVLINILLLLLLLLLSFFSFDFQLLMAELMHATPQDTVPARTSLTVVVLEGGWQPRRVSFRATRPEAPGLLLQVDKKGKWSPSSTKRPHQKPPQRGPPR